LALLGLVLTTLALPALGSVSHRPGADLDNPDLAYLPGQVLVKFVPNAPASAIAGARQAVGARLREILPGIGVQHWQLGKGVSVEKALDILARSPYHSAIEYAEPNYILQIAALPADPPSDPRRGDLWGLHNLGQTGGTKDADIDAFEAWQATTGSTSVIVAVVDTGVDYTHPDLAGNILRDGSGKVVGYDYANNDADPMDDNSHGTHVSGTIGALGNNGVGVIGVCPVVRIMPLKFLDAFGSGDIANAVKAINFAAANGAHIINASWGSSSSSKSLQNAIKSFNGLFVAAAGNSNSNALFYPAGYSLPNILAVAATDATDARAGFSNYGAWVHLAAPGLYILSTTPNNTYSVYSGTSMAAPHVTGVAALVKAKNFGWGYQQIKAQILNTLDYPAALASPEGPNGRLNGRKAVGILNELQADPDTPGQITVQSGTQSDWSAITLTWPVPAAQASGEPAYLYDLRYRTDGPLDDTNWSTATVVSGLPVPQASGIETFTLSLHLCPGTYHFALKAADVAGNWSAISPDFPVIVPDTAWIDERVDASGSYDLGLAFNPSTLKPAMAYIDFYATPDRQVKFASFDGSLWAPESIAIGHRGISLAFNPTTNTPSISWQAYVSWASYYNLSFAERLQNGAWQVTAVESKSVGNSESTSLAYDPAGNPGIAYRHATKGLKFARRVNGSWQTQVVDSAGARYFALAYNPQGNPTIAYSLDVNPADGYIDTLMFAEWNGSAWVKQTVETGVVGFGVFASLAYDPAGNPAIVHQAAGQVRFLRRIGGLWQSAETWPGDSCSLTFGPDGAAYVSYTWNGQIRVARRAPDTGLWEHEVVDPCAGTYWRMPIQVDPVTNWPVLSYGRWNDLTGNWEAWFSHK